jgi:hypothetical protein
MLVEQLRNGIDVGVSGADVDVEAILNRPEDSPKPDVFGVLAVRNDRFCAEGRHPERLIDHRGSFLRVALKEWTIIRDRRGLIANWLRRLWPKESSFSPSDNPGKVLEQQRRAICG